MEKELKFQEEQVSGKFEYDTFARVKSYEGGGENRPAMEMTYGDDEDGREGAGLLERVDFGNTIFETYEYDDAFNVEEKRTYGTYETMLHDEWDRPVRTVRGLSDGVFRPMKAAPGCGDGGVRRARLRRRRSRGARAPAAGLRRRQRRGPVPLGRDRLPLQCPRADGRRRAHPPLRSRQSGSRDPRPEERARARVRRLRAPRTEDRSPLQRSRPGDRVPLRRRRPLRRDDCRAGRRERDRLRRERPGGARERRRRRGEAQALRRLGPRLSRRPAERRGDRA